MNYYSEILYFMILLFSSLDCVEVSVIQCCWTGSRSFRFRWYDLLILIQIEQLIIDNDCFADPWVVLNRFRNIQIE